VERSTTTPSPAASSSSSSAAAGGRKSGSVSHRHNTEEEQVVFAREMAAAKMERMGYSTGFRLCERLSQNRTFAATSVGKDPASLAAAAQLEAVKFLCKEIWTEIFRKQIDKLQTNHRGVFVLKDLELRWLTRLPTNQEPARVAAIQLLAFPCGIIRGALANLGVPAVVSCDFLADGQNMSACSFNVKIK
jgi:trafficking protein particle complex subunit 6